MFVYDPKGGMCLMQREKRWPTGKVLARAGVEGTFVSSHKREEAEDGSRRRLGSTGFFLTMRLTCLVVDWLLNEIVETARLYVSHSPAG